MSAASWQTGPSHNPFLQTSSSQYGAFSAGSASYPTPSPPRSAMTTAPHRRVNGRLLTTQPSRISDVTARDVARIVSSNDVTREKFSEFMSQYGSGKLTPASSEYDRLAGRREDPVAEIRNAMELDIMSRKAAGSGYLLPTSESVNRFSNMQENAGYRTNDLLLRRANTSLSGPLKYGESSDRHLTDITNIPSYRADSVLGSKTVDMTPGLSRSNTFHGASSYSDSLGRRHSESRLYDSEKSSPHESDAHSGLTVNLMEPHPPSHSVGASLTGKYRGTDLDMRDPGRETGRPSKYWLYGAHGRSSSEEGSSSGAGQISNTNRPMTPYRPSDYMYRSEVEEYTTDRDRYHLGNGDRQGVPYTDHGRISSGYGTSHYQQDHRRSEAEERRFLDAQDRRFSESQDRHFSDAGSHSRDYSTLHRSTSRYDQPDSVTVPDVITSSASINSKRSILKKKGYGTYSGHINQHLPALSSPRTYSGTLGRSSSKRVTFNLALNRSRPIMDAY